MTAYLAVYEEAEKAIDEYRWLASERAGRDVGEAAERDWTESHWLRFYRLRFVWHLCGEVYFTEFGDECFGLCSGELAQYQDVLKPILDMFQEGAENLDIIRWSQEKGLPRDQVVRILKALDINSRRLPPPLRALRT